jgi:glutathione S-transferase
MIHFYGAPMSSAGRSHLMLEECGVTYEYHKVNLRDPAEKAEFKKLNPTGKIPFLVDGDLRVPESIAINFYLAEKYAPQLWSTSVEDRARIYSWSLWGITNLQPEVLRVMRHTMMLPPEQRVASEVEAGKVASQRYIDDFEQMLPASGFLVGGKLSVADIDLASILNLVPMSGAAKLGPKAQAWLDNMKSRPSWKKLTSQS